MILRFPAFLALVSLTAFAGCVSGRMANREPDRLFREGRLEEAEKKLEIGLKDEGDGRDQLLYLLDLALVQHTEGKLDESSKFFTTADAIAEIKDYTSLATEASTLLVSDNVKSYKGEDFEKILINVYLALNYALKGDTEGALVESRKVNTKLYRMITEGKRKYQLNAFAYYLNGILYEANGDYDDAYIDYKKAYELENAYHTLGVDLWRVAWLTHREEDLSKWDHAFDLSEDDHTRAKLLGRKSSQGEVIIIYQNGISPIKRPHPSWNSIPKFFPRANPVAAAQVRVDGANRALTYPLYDIEGTAIQNLDDNYAGILAKKIAGVVAKEVVGNQVAKQTNSEALGFLTKLFFYASDQADIRSWNLLPKDLQIARIPVEPGMHKISLDLESTTGGIFRTLPEKDVQVKAGQKVFLTFRFVP